MGFFAEFYAWLDRILVGYIGDYAARIAAAIEPAVITAAVLYVMVWGFLHLTARIEEPLSEGLKRIAVMVIVLGVSLRLWLYNEVIVDTFFNAPTQLAAFVVGAYEPVAVVDEIIFQGGDAGDALIEKGSLFQGNFSYYFAGFGVYLLVGFTAVYTIFLLSLSRVALSILTPQYSRFKSASYEPTSHVGAPPNFNMRGSQVSDPGSPAAGMV